MIAKHLFDDVGNGFILEDPAIAGAAEQPEPGLQGGLIDVEAAVTALLGEVADDAVKIARTAVGQGHFDGDMGAQDVFEGNVRLSAEQGQIEVKQTAKAFMGGHLLEQQNIFTQGGVNFNRAVFLSYGHFSLASVANHGDVESVPAGRFKRRLRMGNARLCPKFLPKCQGNIFTVWLGFVDVSLQHTEVINFVGLVLLWWRISYHWIAYIYTCANPAGTGYSGSAASSL